MDEFEKNDGVSLGQLAKVALHRKWVWIVSTVLVFLIGVLGVYFLYNRNEEKYVASFAYDIPSISGGNYVNGTIFDYRDIVSTDNLQRVKDSDKEKFGSIDVEDMEPEIVRYVVNENNMTSINYEVQIEKKYFSSLKQAKAFFTTLINTPYDLTMQYLEASDYTYNLVQMDIANDLEQKIQLLLDQYLYIQNQYSALVSTYSNALVSSSLKIMDYSKSLDLKMTESDLNALINLVQKEGLIDSNNDKYIEGLRIEMESLLREKTINEAKITALKAQIDELMQDAQSMGISNLNLDAYNQQVAALILRNQDIDIEVGVIRAKVKNAENSAGLSDEYKTNLKKVNDQMAYYKNILLQSTQEYAMVEKTVISKYSLIYFDDPIDIIDETGGFNLILAGVVFLVAGFVLGAGINLIIDRKDLKVTKEEEKSQEK